MRGSLRLRLLREQALRQLDQIEQKRQETRSLMLPLLDKEEPQAAHHTAERVQEAQINPWSRPRNT